ncbi:MAG: electron transport complex subunit E [Ruminococcaceae bacterium]|nr:electron transport complex subunit E [Oscillospiraceae bacterium]
MKRRGIAWFAKEGLLKNNPVLVQLLGLCSVLAVSTTMTNALGMGAAATLVLICSNLLISLLRRLIPEQVRIAAYIVVISGFVTAVQLLIKAYFPAIDKSLGIFIPLIVVNCIVLARAEAFASKNGPVASILDGLFMGIGYTAALLCLAFIREFFGSGTLFGIKVLGEGYPGILVFTMPAGAFICLACVVAAVRYFSTRKGDK